MLLYIGVGGYALLFALVSGLFRYEYQMPRFLCVGFGMAVVALGLLASTAVAVSGVASLQQVSGVSAVALVLSMGGLVVGEGSASV